MWINRKILARSFLFSGLILSMSQAKTAIAFLSIKSERDPLQKNDLLRRIHWTLGADSNFVSYSEEEIEASFKKVALKDVDIDTLGAKAVCELLNAQFILFAHLDPVTIQDKRIIWMPWSHKVKWMQAVQFRIRDVSGNLKFDTTVTAELNLKEHALGNYPRLAELSPLLRDELKGRLLAVLADNISKAASAKLSGLVNINKKK